MSRPATFDDRLDAWLVDGPDAAPTDLLDSVLAELPHSRQQRLVGPFRFPRFAPTPRSMPVAARFLAGGIAALVVVASMMLLSGREPGQGDASPSPTATPMRTLDSELRASPSGPYAFEPCTPTDNPRTSGSKKGFDAAALRGWIAYRDGNVVKAVDPAEPENEVVLEESLLADPSSWSPDGRRLLLMDAATVAPANYAATIVLNSDGSAIRLTDWALGSFSPDGNTVVYSVPGGGLCLVGSDGNGRQLLAFDAGEPLDGGPAWSPDGSVIAWLDFIEDSPAYGHHAFGLSFIRPDGSDLRQLVLRLSTMGDQTAGIAWSPDGARLAFSMLGEIHVVNADASGLRQITTDGGLWPSWSPDGTRIAFVAGGALYTMRPDGSDIRLVPGVAPDGAVAWNPVP
jgi:Tol biopolymer transport system component